MSGLRLSRVVRDCPRPNDVYRMVGLTMSDQPIADIMLIARQQRQILSEIGVMRDDMGVMMAILQRLDGTVVGLVNEVRAMHSQHSRLSKRVSDLETQT